MKNKITILKQYKYLQIYLMVFLFTGIYVCKGQNGCPQIPNSILDGTNGFIVSGNMAQDDLGYTTKSAGDINGDGIADIMIGAPGVDFGGISDVGEIYVIFGGTGFSFDVFDVSTLNGTNGFIIRGVTAGEKLGSKLSFAGDLNGDGLDDIIVGDNFNTSGNGVAFVFYGKNIPFQAIYNRTDIDNTKGLFITLDGAAVTPVRDVSYAGDVNKDGKDDIIITTNINGVAYYYVVFGETTLSNINTSSLTGTNGFTIKGYTGNSAVLDNLGKNAGDINNDGIDDLVLGCPNCYNGSDIYAGKVNVVFGKNLVFPALLELEALSVSDGFSVTNTGQYNYMGKSISTAGDFNHDGIDDIIIGSPGKTIDGKNSTGEVYVLFGRNSFPDTFAIETITPSTGVVFQGTKMGGQFGSHVEYVRDINQDSKDDIIISSKSGISNNGAVYLVFGGNTATGIVKENTILKNIGYQVFDSYVGYSGDTFGFDTSGIGDFNNDGKNDFIIGKIRNSTFYNGKGTAYIFYGETLDRIDAIKPIIECPIDQELYANSTLPNYVSSLSKLDDNCIYTNNSDLTVTQNPPQGTLFTQDTNVTVTVTDLSGNSSSCSFLVKVKSQVLAPTCKTFNYALNELDGSNGFTIYGEVGAEKTGFSVDKAGDVNGDGLEDFILSARGETYNFSGAFKNTTNIIKGNIYVIFGKTSGFPPIVDLKYLDGSNGFKIRDNIDLTVDDQTGVTVSSAGDLNGDGIDDIMMGASTKKGTAWNTGAVYVVFGKTGIFPAEILLSNLDGNNGFRFLGTNYYEASGYSIDDIGDFNNDGFDDIAIAGTGNYEKIYIVYGRNGSFPAQILGTDINGTNGFVITSNPAIDKVGRSVTGLGDINGDGVPDIALSSYDGIKKYVIYGRSGFPTTFNVEDINGINGIIVTHSAQSLMYGDVSKVGDLNQDGFNDIAFSKKYILFGSSSLPAAMDLNNINGTNGFQLVNAAEADKFGSIGDFNNDGIDDYIFTDTGFSSYVLYGKTNWTNPVDLLNITPKDGIKITNQDYYNSRSLSFAGDINHDGYDDIIIGTSKNYYDGLKVNQDPGKAYVLYGRQIVSDIEKPVFTNCPTNQILAVGDPIPDYKNTITLTDNCDDNPVVTQIPVPGTTYTGGIQNITLTATDASTNSQTCSFPILAAGDTEDPVLICPGNQQLACGSLIPSYFDLLTVSDNVDQEIDVTQYPGEGSTFYDGIEIFFTAKDDAGNEATCSIIVNASGPDTQPPTFTCPTNATLNCGDIIPNYATDPMMNLADNCSNNVHYEMTPAPGTPFYDGISIKITYTDESGNADECNFVVHSATSDLTAPIITCAGDQTLACGNTLPDYRNLISASDNCGGTITYIQNPAPGTAFTDGMTITMTAKDVSNNESYCTFQVNASADGIRPVITCIGDQTLPCGSTIPDYRNLISVTDNCDTSPILTQNPIAGTIFSDGMTISITAKDASNNESYCSFKINVSTDLTKPVITCIGDQTLSCRSTIPDYTTLIKVTDNCDSSPVVTQNPIPGTAFTDGMIVTMTAKDISANESYCSFKVNASADVIKPVITCIGDQTLSCGSIIPDYTPLVTATDNCDASPIITQNPPAGSVFTDGMIINMTATDVSNNESYCSFKINASADVTKPVIICIADQSLNSGETLPDYRSMITATDNCDSNLVITQIPAAGTNVTDGMIITMNTSDNSGNISSCTFKINVIQDNEPPVFTCLTDQMFDCSVIVVPDYTKMIPVTDNTDPNPIIVQTPAPGVAFVEGMTIYIKVSDKYNNNDECSFQLFTYPIFVDAGEDVEINEGQFVKLQAVALENGNFSWSPATGLNNNKVEKPIATPSETTTYTVVFTNKDGCQTEDSVTITVIPLQKDETKYGFSPNNDGINDFWKIDGITDYPENEVLIYSRWGDLVYQTKGYDNASNVFNGIANKSRNMGADQLPEGTYFFEIRVNQPNHLKKLKGYLVLKR